MYQVKGKSQKMMIFGILADEKGLKLGQIPQYLGISPIKLKIIFPVYISRWIGLDSDWSVPIGEG